MLLCITICKVLKIFSKLKGNVNPSIITTEAQSFQDPRVVWKGEFRTALCINSSRVSVHQRTLFIRTRGLFLILWRLRSLKARVGAGALNFQ